MNNIYQPIFSSPLLVFLLSAMLSPAIFAQATSGVILGQITDSARSVVSGASVTVTNEATGLKREATADEGGSFYAPNLPPGIYTIEATRAGFKKASRSGVKLLVDQKLRVDFTMEVGDLAVVVKVTAETPILQTETPDTGEVIQSRQILDLPLLGRDFRDLTRLTAGVAGGAGGNTLNLSVNGQREFANSFMVDGVEATGNRNNDTSLRPSVDSVEEFKVVTSAYAAEFGRASGAVISFQTKAGGNDFHGSLYEFFRPNSTAARSYFAQAPAALKQHNFGATLGGPIIKNKTFFFGSYEGLRLRDAFSYLTSVPPAGQIKYLANGDVDLSGLVDPYTGTQIPIFDPEFYATNFYAQQFPDNVIPANRVSRAGKAVLQNFFPQPTLPGESNGWFSNFVGRQAYRFNADNYDARFDHNFSEKDRVSATYHYSDFDSRLGDPFDGAVAVAGGGGADSGDATTTRNQALSVTQTHLFSQNWLNEFRFGLVRFRLDQLSLVEGRDLSGQYGLGNLNLPNFPQTSGFPYIFLGFGGTTGGSTYKPLLFLDQNVQVVNHLSGRVGVHAVKFGFEFRRLRANPNFSLFPTSFQYFGGPYLSLTQDPSYSFFDAGAFYPTGGSDIADLLLGLPYSVSTGLQLTNPTTVSREFHFYGQDSWQVNRRLVFSYGLRYEYQAPFREVDNLASNFDPVTKQIRLAGLGGNSESLIEPDRNNFGPRIGFALKLNERTALRGGYGVYFSPENDARSDVLTKNYPFAARQDYFNDVLAGLPFAYQLDAGVPRDTAIEIPSGASNLTLAQIRNSKNQSVFYVDPNFRTGYSQLFNLTVQRELISGLGVEVGYVGATGRKLPYAIGDINLDGRISDSLGRVEGQFARGSSSFHSMQIKLNKRMTSHLSFLGAYTLGKAIDNGPAPFNLGRNQQRPQDPFNLRLERAVSSTDVRQNLVLSYIYEPPIGKGRALLPNLHGFGQAALGGWQINGITQLRSGLPVNVVRNGRLPGSEGLRPNLTGDPILSRSDRTLERYFDVTAFSVAGLGTTALGSAGRNVVRGPGYVNFDFSLFKNIPVRERVELQLRFEFFNLLNTPHFENPNTDFSEGNFGRITGTIGNPRILQFAAKLKF